jgi:RNA polymerase sigma-70 factor (ECF subfamily)
MVSVQTIALTEGVLRVMFLQKLGLIAVSLLIINGLAIGGGAWARQAVEQTSPDLVPTTALPSPITSEFGTPERNPEVEGLAVLQTKKARSNDGVRELSYDDGEMKGKKSIAGGGHAVRFEAPGEGWTLAAVRIHGARYGYPRPPREDFKVFLCDEKFQKIAEFAFPYSKFERGESKWVTLQVRRTKVPKTFILGVDFDPTQTKGVYVSHDKEGSGRSSVGLPGDEPRPFKQGDWLIRARIEPAQEQDAKTD